MTILITDMRDDLKDQRSR